MAKISRVRVIGASASRGKFVAPNKRNLRLLAFLILLALLVPSAKAQLYTGSVTGVVTDPSGALVPSANVTLTDELKGYTYSAKTDAAGRYLIRQVPPGKYTIKVEAPGFQTEQQKGITLNINQNVSVDFSLKVGQAAEVVEVAASAVQLQTQDAVTGQVINRTFLNDLPLVNRNAFDLVFLAPGMVHTDTDTSGNATGVNFNSNGSRNSTADVLIDGATATNFEQNSGIQNVIYEPPVDAIEEFKVQQSNFSAEFGFAGATVVNLITRSGTNEFHGGLYEFWRNQILDANDWFNNATATPIPALRRNQFGGTVGGPIKRDKTFFFFDYEGLREHSANSSFFGVPTLCERGDPSAVCPVNGSVLGNFEELCTHQGGTFNPSGQCSVPSGQLWDPYTGTFDSTGSIDPNGPGSVRSTFIPFNNLAAYTSSGPGLPSRAGNLIDPLAANFFAVFPKPNQAVTSLSGAQTSNFFVAGVNKNSDNKFDIKIDHRFNESNLFSAKYSQDKGNGHSLNCFGNFVDPCTSGPSDFRHQVVAANYTHTFTPALLLNFTGGYLRGFDFSHGVGADFSNFNTLITSLLTCSGAPCGASNLEKGGLLTAVPFINLTSGNYSTTIGGTPFAILREGQDVVHLGGTLSWVRAKHELKFGGEWRLHRISFVQPGWPAGEFDFDFTGTSQFANAGDTSSGGDDMASLLIGVGPPANSAGGGCAPCFAGFDNFVSTQSFRWGTFVQDNFHVSRKLTLNLGLRYDLSLPRTERFNRMNWLDPNLVSPIHYASQPVLVQPVPGVTPVSVLHGGEVFAGVNGASRSNYYADYKNIQPRFGFAYQLPHDLVARGGYGIYFSTPRNGASGTGPWGFQGFDNQPPWITVDITSSTSLNNRIPCCRLNNPAPSGYPAPPGSKFGAANDLGFAAVGPVPSISLRTPYEQAWSFGFQKGLPGKILLDTTYIGKKGTHLYLGGFREMDFLGPAFEKARLSGLVTPGPSGTISTLVTADQPNPFFCSTCAPNNSDPTAGLPNFIVNPNSGLSGPTISRYQLLLPFPQFLGFQGDSPPIANSIYHAFQLRAEKQFSAGLQFLVTYTVSKSIDTASATDDSISWLGGGTPGGSTLDVQNPNDLRAERAVSVFDTPKILQFSYVYQLPVGRGKPFGSHMNSILNAVIGGWQTNGNWTLHSGIPILPRELDSAIPIPTYHQRPTITAPLERASGSVENSVVTNASPTSYFANPGVISETAPFSLGNASRTITSVRQPPTRIANLSLFKEFPLGNVHEGMRLEFRAETFNAFNHPQFAGPHTRVGSGIFGLIDSTINPSREMQLALKLYF